jgi:hypothetical protein
MTNLNLSIELSREAFSSNCKATKLAATYADLFEAMGFDVTREEAMEYGKRKLEEIKSEIN